MLSVPSGHCIIYIFLTKSKGEGWKNITQWRAVSHHTDAACACSRFDFIYREGQPGSLTASLCVPVVLDVLSWLGDRARLEIAGVSTRLH